MKIFYRIIFCLLFFSCNKSKIPNHILSPEKMEVLLWEQTKADIFTQEFISKDSSKNLFTENFKLQEKIFSKYNTDRKTFYKSYKYYIGRDELMKPLLDSMVVRNNRLREKESIKSVIKPANEQVK